MLVYEELALEGLGAELGEKDERRARVGDGNINVCHCRKDLYRLECTSERKRDLSFSLMIQ